MKPRLIFAEDREEAVALLQQAFDGCPELKAVKMPPAEFRTLDELDALYLNLPYAERWGAKPILYKAQVLKTKTEDEGLPRYVIAGGATHPDQLKDAGYELRQLIVSVLEAVEMFNRENPDEILVVGFLTEMAGMNRLSPNESGRIIRDMYEYRLRAAA